MPKPKTKDELLQTSQANYETLLKLVNSYSDEEILQEFKNPSLNRNVRDVLAHVHHWHLLLLDWYKVGMQDKKPDMPAKGYTWQTTPDLNKKIWEEYKDVDIKKAKTMLSSSFSKVQKIINKHTEEELFEKKRYKWTGSTSLGAYLILNTTSHYNWAIKTIKKSKKA